MYMLTAGRTPSIVCIGLSVHVMHSVVWMVLCLVSLGCKTHKSCQLIPLRVLFDKGTAFQATCIVRCSCFCQSVSSLASHIKLVCLHIPIHKRFS